MTNKRSYSFPIYSPQQKINLPFVIDRCNAIRISQLMFKFSDFNKKVLLLSFSSLDSNSYFDGVNNVSYTFIQFNDGSKNTINYINNLPTYDSYFPPKNIMNLDIQVKIDNEYDNIISTENALYITLDFYSN